MFINSSQFLLEEVGLPASPRPWSFSNGYFGSTAKVHRLWVHRAFYRPLTCAAPSTIKELSNSTILVLPSKRLIHDTLLRIISQMRKSNTIWNMKLIFMPLNGKTDNLAPGQLGTKHLIWFDWTVLNIVVIILNKLNISFAENLYWKRSKSIAVPNCPFYKLAGC